MSLVPGLKGSASVRVIHENTAAVVGSGSLEVFATPMMIALMENAALNTVKPFLAEGEGRILIFHKDRCQYGYRGGGTDRSGSQEASVSGAGPRGG